MTTTPLAAHGCEPGDCTWRPTVGRRIRLAWEAAVPLLADGNWHAKAELVPVMVKASDIYEESAANVLREARRHELLEPYMWEGRRWYLLTDFGRERIERWRRQRQVLEAAGLYDG